MEDPDQRQSCLAGGCWASCPLLRFLSRGAPPHPQLHPHQPSCLASPSSHPELVNCNALSGGHAKIFPLPHENMHPQTLEAVLHKNNQPSKSGGTFFPENTQETKVSGTPTGPSRSSPRVSPTRSPGVSVAVFLRYNSHSTPCGRGWWTKQGLSDTGPALQISPQPILEHSVGSERSPSASPHRPTPVTPPAPWAPQTRSGRHGFVHIGHFL